MTPNTETSLLYQLNKCCDTVPYLDIRIDYGCTLLLESYCPICKRKVNVSHKFSYPGDKLDLFQIHQFRSQLVREWNKLPTGLLTNSVDKLE